jgi:hypothetical protein
MRVLWLLVLLVGCAHPTKQVVTTSLETLIEEQARVGAIAGSPELQEAARKLSKAVVDGSLEALSDDDRAVLLEARSKRRCMQPSCKPRAHRYRAGWSVWRRASASRSQTC